MGRAMTIGYAPIERGLGLALLAGAAALAQPALDSQAVVEIMRHAPACLGGAPALAGALLSWRGFARCA